MAFLVGPVLRSCDSWGVAEGEVGVGESEQGRKSSALTTTEEDLGVFGQKTDTTASVRGRGKVNNSLPRCLAFKESTKS